MKRTTWKGAVGVLAVAAGLVAFGTPATASGPSQVVVQPNPINLTLGTNATVTANLDANCSNALDNGLDYGILVTGLNSDTATASIGTPSTVHCDPTAATPPAISFTFIPVGCGSTSATFTAVAMNKKGKMIPGQNNNLIPTTVPVSVTGSTCSSGTVPPPPAVNPAAPAVANQYINEQLPNDYIPFTCASGTYKKAGKLWRGALIKDVAAWMPLPENVKDDQSIFPNNLWVDLVVSEVDSLCTGGGNVALPAGLSH